MLARPGGEGVHRLSPGDGVAGDAGLGVVADQGSIGLVEKPKSPETYQTSLINHNSDPAVANGESGVDAIVVVDGVDPEAGVGTGVGVMPDDLSRNFSHHSQCVRKSGRRQHRHVSSPVP